jgi:hypothetical protein
MSEYMDLTVAISASVIPWRGKWGASLVESTDMAADDVATLDRVVGYGDTPIEAAADLLNQAAKQRQEQA